jgi:hypothetical protein
VTTSGTVSKDRDAAGGGAHALDAAETQQTALVATVLMRARVFSPVAQLTLRRSSAGVAP